LLNLITIPEARQYLPLLRQEIDSVFSISGAWTNPDTFNSKNIPLTMAFMRESMRFSPLTANIPVRSVVAKEGVVLPDGTYVPQGSWLACPAEALTRDDRLYCDPDVFNPFRFLDLVPGSADRSKSKYILRPKTDVTVADDSFLYFGYGRHFW